MRRITVLGSTGSIGAQALDLVARAAGDWQVVALTGGDNIDRLAGQAVAHRAEIAVTADESRLGALRDRLAGTGIACAAGRAALLEAAARPADVTLSAIVGAAGLGPGLAALLQGGTLALANKESLVCAGPLLMETARRHGARILPVDSEHSAIFQALRGEDIAAVERITITASGGAFRDWPVERLARATPEQAASHPNWDMGQRITIDSASMFNKALELIETHEFFGLPPERIGAILHPESLVHALVAFRDGAVMAHMGSHDMRHAIGFALNWPERRDLPVAPLDLAAAGTLTFRAADEGRWPALRLAREAMGAGPLAGAILNGAKERALDHFLARRIGFQEMAQHVERALNTLAWGGVADPVPSLDTVEDADSRARAAVDDALTTA